MTVTNIRSALNASSYGNSSSAAVKKALADFGLSRSWLHLTVSRLGGLPMEKFQAYVRLFKRLADVADREGVRGPLKVITPSIAALTSISVDALMESKEAWKEILKVVYLPEKKQIDLRELIWIQKRFRPQ